MMISQPTLRVVNVLFLLCYRLLKRFYSSDPSICGTLGDNGKINKLGCRYTLPVFLMWATIHLPLWGTGEGRAIYWRGCVIAITAGWLVCLRY